MFSASQCLIIQDPLLGVLGMEEDPLKETQDKLLDWLDRFQFDAKKIDVFSRLIFPTAWVLFNTVYWAYYLTTDKRGHS